MGARKRTNSCNKWIIKERLTGRDTHRASVNASPWAVYKTSLVNVRKKHTFLEHMLLKTFLITG